MSSPLLVFVVAMPRTHQHTVAEGIRELVLWTLLTLYGNLILANRTERHRILSQQWLF